MNAFKGVAILLKVTTCRSLVLKKVRDNAPCGSSAAQLAKKGIRRHTSIQRDRQDGKNDGPSLKQDKGDSAREDVARAPVVLDDLESCTLNGVVLYRAVSSQEGTCATA